MEKQCIICKILQPLENYYTHKRMSDGHLNKCKSCCKTQSDEREKKLRQDNPDWVEKEKQRHKEKYYRLEYKDKHKPTYEKKKQIIDKYKSKYPEKLKAKNATSNFSRKEGYELHHWSYNECDWKDIVELSIKDHNKIHTHMIYDTEFMYYRDNQNNLLNTKQKHLDYIKQFI